MSAGHCARCDRPLLPQFPRCVYCGLAVGAAVPVGGDVPLHEEEVPATDLHEAGEHGTKPRASQQDSNASTQGMGVAVAVAGDIEAATVLKAPGGKSLRSEPPAQDGPSAGPGSGSTEGGRGGHPGIGTGSEHSAWRPWLLIGGAVLACLVLVTWYALDGHNLVDRPRDNSANQVQSKTDSTSDQLDVQRPQSPVESTPSPNDQNRPGFQPPKAQKSEPPDESTAGSNNQQRPEFQTPKTTPCIVGSSCISESRGIGHQPPLLKALPPTVLQCDETAYGEKGQRFEIPGGNSLNSKAEIKSGSDPGWSVYFGDDESGGRIVTVRPLRLGDRPELCRITIAVTLY